MPQNAFQFNNGPSIISLLQISNQNSMEIEERVDWFPLLKVKYCESNSEDWRILEAKVTSFSSQPRSQTRLSIFFLIDKMHI